MIKTFIIAAMISMSVGQEAYAFDRNISGLWRSDKTGKWLITQVGKRASFIQQSYDEEFGQRTYSFDGYIKSDGALDSFSFEGKSDDLYIRTKEDDYCMLSFELFANGYVNGEFGGRIIHMKSCMVKVEMYCVSEKTSASVINCSGVWK